MCSLTGKGGFERRKPIQSKEQLFKSDRDKTQELICFERLDRTKEFGKFGKFWMKENDYLDENILNK
jgi:hypothetical protein